MSPFSATPCAYEKSDSPDHFDVGLAVRAGGREENDHAKLGLS